MAHSAACARHVRRRIRSGARARCADCLHTGRGGCPIRRTRQAVAVFQRECFAARRRAHTARWHAQCARSGDRSRTRTRHCGARRSLRGDAHSFLARGFRRRPSHGGHDRVFDRSTECNTTQHRDSGGLDSEIRHSRRQDRALPGPVHRHRRGVCMGMARQRAEGRTFRGRPRTCSGHRGRAVVDRFAGPRRAGRSRSSHCRGRILEGRGQHDPRAHGARRGALDGTLSDRARGADSHGPIAFDHRAHGRGLVALAEWSRCCSRTAVADEIDGVRAHDRCCVLGRRARPAGRGARQR